MLPYHTPEQDLPSHTGRERDRQRLDAALNDFLANGVARSLR